MRGLCFQMPKLLVSVRSDEEAGDALAGGADVIDVKEPARGSLGRPELATVLAVLARIAGRAEVSAALGELIETDLAALPSPPEGLRFVKLGMAGCLQTDWTARWRAVRERLPRTTELVAVLYADWPTAGCPSPQQLLPAAVELGCRTLLIDTFDKTRGGLLEHLPLPRLADVLGQYRDAGFRIVLAGSLSLETIAAVMPLRPDLIAVRGAACAGGRAGRVCLEKVRQLKAVCSPAFRRKSDVE